MDRESLAAGAAVTAAELREQLARITAASQLLERTAGAKELGYLATLNQSICQMLRTVSRMELAYRLTDENEIRAFPDLLDLGFWTEDLARSAQSVLALAHVTLTWDTPSNLLANVDKDLLRHMVLEMLSSAAEAGRQIQLSLSLRGNKVHFTVTGTGQLLPKVEAPDCITVEGESLSIAMIRQIAQLHGGTLVTCTGKDSGLSLTAILPQRLDLPGGRLQSPHREPASGGFDPALVAFSHLLSKDAFQPEELN